MDPYALIAQIPNAGQSFSDAFAKGQQQNALAAFATNPTSQTAGAAARYDPSAVLSYNLQSKKDTAALSAQHQKDWHDYAGNLAAWADTPDKWDHAVDQMVAQGFPEAASLKGKFTPQLRASFMALGGNHDQQDPGIIHEYDTAKERRLIPADVTYEQYLSMARPGNQQPIVLPQSYTQVGGGGGASLPSVSSPQEAAKLPPGTQFRMPDGRVGTVPGGQTGSAPSATFP